MNGQAQHSILPLLTRLWKDQSGAVLSSELVILGTMLFCGTVVGVFTVRAIVLQVLMGVAVDISAEQTHTFDTLDRFVDTDADGFRGYAVLTTPADFDTIYDGDGAIGTDPNALGTEADQLDIELPSDTNPHGEQNIDPDPDDPSIEFTDAHSGEG